MPFLKQSTSQTIRFGPCLDKTDGVTEETGLTLAQADMRLSKDGGAFAQKNAAGNATHDSDGWYSTTLDATDTATVGELILNVHQPANMLPVWMRWWVLEEAIYDSLFGASAAGFDSNQRVDVGSWLGTAVTTSSTTNKPQVDVDSIDDDATAADNAQLFFDGTGYAGGTTKLDVNIASTDDIDLSATQKASVNTEVDNSMVTYGLDHLISASVADTDVADNSIVAKFADSTAVTADFTNFDWTTDSFRAIRDHIGDGTNLTEAGGTGDHLTAIDLPNQTMDITGDITGNLSGSVGSVTGAVGSVTGAVGSVTAGVTLANGAVTDASLAGNMEIVYETDFATNYNTTRNAWATNVQDTVGTGNLPADAVAISGDTTTADNLQVLFDGVEGLLAAYAGPHGPGVYMDDAAANTSTANGVDGTPSNPVSDIAAAKTIADSLNIDRFYITNDSTFTLAATMDQYIFVGLTDAAINTINMGDRLVNNCAFYNLTLEGDVNASSGRSYAENCILADESGAGTSTFHLYAVRCGFLDSFRVTANDDHIFDQCYSMVAGNGTPVIDNNSVVADISLRHYSGGIEFQNTNASTTISVETDGQVIFNANCNTGTSVTMRGCMTITDNTGGMSSLTREAVTNRTDWIGGAYALNTTASGNVGIDWANVENPTTAVDLSATDIQLADTTTDVANQVSADVTGISGDSTAADRLEAMMDGIIIGQVNDPGAIATTTDFAADNFTEATDDHFNGRLITFITGALTGQQTDITDYDAAGGAQGNQQFTVTALTEAPANDVFFVIH